MAAMDMGVRLRRYRRPGALEAFEDRTAWPMMTVVVLSLVTYIATILSPPSYLRLSLALVDALLWSVFLVEFAVRCYIAMDRWGFVRHNLIDLAVVVGGLAVPAMRALRIVRLARIGVLGARVVDQSDAVFKRSNVKFAFLLAGLMVLIAAVMVWGAEKDANHHTIKSLGDALWWAISTATTVGYGDRYPVSPEGKVIAAGLMILGIGVLGLVSAALASKLVETGTQSEHEELRQRMESLESKLDAVLASNGLPDGQATKAAASSHPGSSGSKGDPSQ